MSVSHLSLPPLTKQDINRFWSKVAVGSPNECWEWQAARVKGYGTFRVCRNGTKKNVKAHRVAYSLGYNEDPVHYLVRHKCDNPPCCNPSHLLKGFDKDNIQDALDRGLIPVGDKAWPHLNASRMSRGATHYLNLYPELRKIAIERLRNADRVRGEKQHSSKMTANLVVDARLRYANGETIYKLAKTYGISWPSMDKIVKRVSWKHVN